MTRLTDLSQEQRGMALAMKQAQNWRGRERVSFWWPLLGWAAYTALVFVVGGVVL